MNEQYDGKVEQKLLISAKVKTRANLDARRLLIYQAVYVVPQYMLDKPQLRVYVCVYWPGAMDISPLRDGEDVWLAQPPNICSRSYAQDALYHDWAQTASHLAQAKPQFVETT